MHSVGEVVAEKATQGGIDCLNQTTQQDGKTANRSQRTDVHCWCSPGEFSPPAVGQHIGESWVVLQSERRACQAPRSCSRNIRGTHAALFSGPSESLP